MMEGKGNFPGKSDLSFYFIRAGKNLTTDEIIGFTLNSNSCMNSDSALGMKVPMIVLRVNDLPYFRFHHF